MPLAFVTVGTTEFDSLIRSVTSERVVQSLKSLGITQILLQIGRGAFEPAQKEVGGVKIVWYRFKPSLAVDFGKADIVIGHAGAGTCLEALELGKKFVVVINDTLADNHQLELAKRLHQDGHLLYCTPDDLSRTLESDRLHQLTPWTKGDPKVFANWLDEFVGLRRQS